MINLPRIQALAERREFERLLEQVLRNGRPLPVQVRLRLSEPGAVATAGLSLALQRALELTYRPTGTTVFLLSALLEEEHSEGGFGHDECGRPHTAATATALAAMLLFVRQLDALPNSRGTPGAYTHDAALDARLRSAIDPAIHALYLAQQRPMCGARFQTPGSIGDEVDSAIVLWQLALEPRVAAGVDLEALASGAESRGLRHSRTAGAILRMPSDGVQSTSLAISRSALGAGRGSEAGFRSMAPAFDACN